MISKFVIVLILCVCLTRGQNRKVTDFINPGCPEGKCDKGSAALIHVEAVGTNDTLHHIWDFTFKPTIFLALTDKKAVLNIDWDKFLSNDSTGSANFSVEPKYIFSITLDKIVEFNDVNNTGLYDNNNTSHDYVNIVNTTSFSWKIHKDVNNFQDGVIYTLRGDLNNSDGFINITLSAFGNKDHSELQPHLLHTSNATQIDIVFNNMKTNFKHSRFAVGIMVVNTNKESLLSQTKRKSLDDEHSPGIFTVTEVLTPLDEPQHGYLQWRKVAYTSKERIMTNSTDVTDYTAFQVRNWKQGLAQTFTSAFFGHELGKLPVNFMFVSFGSQNDGFYSKTRFTSWTFLAGVGYPAEESFSMLVILILSIGLLGIPVLVIAFGTLYLIARRISNTRDDILTQ